jgi:Mg/Co/Ni transporter MgtE (contains CBS domain)
MTAFTTFYLSRLLDKHVIDTNGGDVGIVKDLFIDTDNDINTTEKPMVSAIKLKKNGQVKIFSFDTFRITKKNGRVSVSCRELKELKEPQLNEGVFIGSTILDRQIVDLHGRKLVRVNDIRLVQFPEGTLLVAVDVGTEGLLRRIGIVKPIKKIFEILGKTLPAKFIHWEDVEAVDFSNLNIKLVKSYSKLQMLHPSDLADIIEDLGKKSSTDVFMSLDEERAADVLEELEPEKQVEIIESLSVEKAADVLEKMPADEAADIIDELESDKAERLLKEMETDTSTEVRELLEYPDHSVGSIMNTEVLTFNKDLSISDVIASLRSNKPEMEELYNLFVTDSKDKLIATFSMRDLLLALPEEKVKDIMKPAPVHLRDDQKMDEVAEMISKYNMLAIPVVDDENILQGMVVVDVVVDDLIDRRRTNK